MERNSINHIVSSERIRIFLGLPLATFYASHFERYQHYLSQNRAIPIRWIYPPSLHLTLYFFGEVAVSDLSVIEESVEPVIKAYAPIRLEFTELNAFPSNDEPGVIWVGERLRNSRLYQLQSDLERALMQCGFQPSNRPYCPHVTLGRIRSQSVLSLESLQPPSWPSHAVTSCAIFHRVSRAEQSHYEVLKSYPLLGHK